MTDIYTLAEAKFGKPNLRASTEDELRFGPSGKISVRRSDGVWIEFGTNNSGRLISMGAGDQQYSRHERIVTQQSQHLDVVRHREAVARQQVQLQRAQALWTRGQPITGSLVEAYLKGRLKGRSVRPPDTAIKFVPDLWHGPSATRWPAMIAAITDMATGDLIGVHRTFLDGSAKAPITPNKMILGSKKGGVIRLVPDDYIDTRLALAEGIETALTAIGEGWSCWAAVDAGNLKVLPIWPATDLIIFTDNDRAGLEAAKQLAQRWKGAGGHADISMPKQEGVDWNDLLK